MNYSESKGEKPFNWTRALLWAPFTSFIPFYHKYLTSKSRNWTTCACGNQCNVLPRWSYGGPQDPDLRDLGAWFNNKVEAKQWKEAKQLLIKIEQRSAYLIKDLTA